MKVYHGFVPFKTPEINLEMPYFHTYFCDEQETHLYDFCLSSSLWFLGCWDYEHLARFKSE